MKTVTFTEFRKNASGLFSAVEQGEIFVIIRHGRPIAEISPVSAQNTIPGWKKPALRLSTDGKGLSEAILAERSNENIL